LAADERKNTDLIEEPWRLNDSLFQIRVIRAYPRLIRFASIRISKLLFSLDFELKLLSPDQFDGRRQIPEFLVACRH
jgi:hypothetical protein